MGLAAVVGGGGSGGSILGLLAPNQRPGRVQMACGALTCSGCPGLHLLQGICPLAGVRGTGVKAWKGVSEDESLAPNQGGGRAHTAGGALISSGWYVMHLSSRCPLVFPNYRIIWDLLV